MFNGGWGTYQEWEAHGFHPRPPGEEPADHGPVSGVLPVAAEPEPAHETPPTPTSLPIGPRGAGRKSMARREKKSKKLLPLAAPPTPAPAPEALVSPLADAGPWAEPKEPVPLSVEASNPKQLVRPYTRTGGRTHAGYRLELETLLSTPLGRERETSRLRDDLRAICQTCRMPASTAEIAAKLGLPLGAARVLIADVVDLGLLTVHETAGDNPSMDLLFRVASGLRNL